MQETLVCHGPRGAVLARPLDGDLRADASSAPAGSASMAKLERIVIGVDFS
ncbi:MAG: hypothetical protein U0163_12550 [Gemmatimonadaceae bacterium]